MRRLAIATAALSVVLVSCDKEMSITLKPDAGETLYFGENLGGAAWLGRPVFVDANGAVQLGSFAGVIPWAERCARGQGDDLARTAVFRTNLDQNFAASELRESIAGNPEGWRQILPRVLALKGNAPATTADQFVDGLQDPVKGFAKLMFPFLRNPTLRQDMEPSSSLGFSRRSFAAGATAGLAEKLEASLSFEKRVLHAVVTSRTGTLALDEFSRNCVIQAARALDPKPTHIVDSLQLGVLFQFDVEVKDLKTSAAGPAGEVKLSGKLGSKDVRINAALAGKVKPPSMSLMKIYDPDKPADVDTQILSYFYEFAKGIETPVFVSAHLTRIP